MAVRYYPESDATPEIVRLILTRICIFMAEHLYADDYDPSDPDCMAIRRIAVSSMQGGNDFHMRRSVEASATDPGGADPVTQAINQFSDLMENGRLPMTFYSVAEEIDGDKKNWLAQSQTVYAEEIGRYGNAIHRQITFPMVSFFSKEADYHQAMKKLRTATAVLTRLSVPIIFNRLLDEVSPQLKALYETGFPVDITLDLAQGEYAYDFQAYLTKNKVWDLKHDVKVQYWDFDFGDYLAGQTIQQMILNLYEWPSKKLDYTNTFDPSAPSLVSSSPVNNATGISTSVANISFTFSMAMDMLALQNQITFSPEISADVSWNDDHTTITYTPWAPLVAATSYTATIPGINNPATIGASSYYGKPVSQDIVVTFSTT
jgi:hypothetical protein